MICTVLKSKNKSGHITASGSM